MLIIATAFPLAYATKSIVLPIAYVMVMRRLKFETQIIKNCFFTEQFAKSSERNTMAEKRETVLRAIYLSKE